MSGDQYTQVRRPVSRIAEKVLGWLSWVFLLLLTIITMFIALVSFSSETSIQRLETSLNGNDFIQQILANNSLNTTQFVIWLQNGIWAVIVYFIICLLVSFLALISMNIRILSGILFLVASVVTLPLVLLFVPLIIPILFFITAIMMFARKDKVETVPGYYADEPYDAYERYERPANEGRYNEPEEPVKTEYQSDKGTADEQQDSTDNRLRRGGYSSDVAQKVNVSNSDSEEEPTILSRQAKYNYKNKKQQEEFGDVSSVYDEDGNAVNDNSTSQQEDEMTREQNDALERERQQREEEEAQRRQAEYEEQQRLKYEEAQRKEREKQERAEEKARIKKEKKERKQREKERRKQMPSAANQRRMNFEERKKMTAHDEKEENVKDSVENSAQTKDKDK
ncbi:DUF4064 domain-containing protein [Staphylococcus gallinarum]|uniref:DUF4064 domain-containing protein n=1 Tax=Staphylococcus gallinarum TaxID=1293 RepID=A0A3A0VLI9_STAGA|nr:DUF4064 domain-containing protein [Staphylococcus gallinarum]RIP35657.1 DUF4064 domain-containing protein [Staphylococcus gallinarum]